MSVPRFDLGEGITIRLTFRDPDTRQLADPAPPVVVTIDPPPGDPMPATRTIQATRRRKGFYVVDTVGDHVGLWNARGASALPGPGVWEGVFEVRPSRMR
jgi:hypothetical protein